ncbi:MAG: hypothetical protein VX278_17255 [Myxococcota bacterium]|nr:hypothetical protein [Myxococcota bacterium]
MTLLCLFACPRHLSVTLPKEEFYTVNTSDQEILSALCEPQHLRTLKRAVGFVIKSYHHSFVRNIDPEELESEVILRVFKKVKRREGLTFPHNYHAKFSWEGWFFSTFRNAARDILREELLHHLNLVNDNEEILDYQVLPGFNPEQESLYRELKTLECEFSLERYVCESSSVNDNRRLLTLLLHFPERVSFTHFSAVMFNRPLSSVWNVWTQNREKYIQMHKEDTRVLSNSRVFIVWLLFGDAFSEPEAFQFAEPTQFGKHRDALRQTVLRTLRHSYQAICVYIASSLFERSPSFFRAYFEMVAAYLYRGNAKAFANVLANACETGDVDRIALVLFSRKKTITDRLSDHAMLERYKKQLQDARISAEKVFKQ